MPYNIIKERAYPMIISENMQKITSNKVLENISVIQLSEVLCELDLMGALKNELIPEETVSAVQIVPAEWYTVTRTNVGIVTKKNYTAKGMAEYTEWETKDVYQRYQSMLVAMGRTKDACIVGKLVCSVDEELKHLEKMVENLKFVDYDPIYIAEIQKEMHDKYKKMMKA